MSKKSSPVRVLFREGRNNSLNGKTSCSMKSEYYLGRVKDWKVADGKSGDGDSDELTRARWTESGGELL